MDDGKTNALVPSHSRSLSAMSSGSSSILSCIVNDILTAALSRDLCEPDKRFRIGRYEFCEPDYRQLQAWTATMGYKTVDVLVEHLQEMKLCTEDGETISFIVEDGKIVSLAWSLWSLQPPVFIVGVNLAIERFAIYGDSNDYGESKRDIVLSLLSLKVCVVNWADISFSLSGMPNLDQLQWEGPFFDASELKHVPRLTKLVCCEAELIEIDLSLVPNLIELNCCDNSISQLDLSHVPSLKILRCEGKHFEIALIPNLQEISIGGGARPADFDFRKTPNIEVLDCGNCDLFDLDLTDLPNLKVLNCAGNKLRTLDLREVPNLQSLICSRNHIEHLDLSHVPRLEKLEYNNNSIKEIDFAPALNLISVSCSGNDISELNIGILAGLRQLYCDNNALTGLDIGQNHRLEELKCARNKIENLEISQYVPLRRLSCVQNPMLNLDLSKNVTLQEIRCDEHLVLNLIPGHKVTKWKTRIGS